VNSWIATLATVAINALLVAFYAGRATKAIEALSKEVNEVKEEQKDQWSKIHATAEDVARHGAVLLALVGLYVFVAAVDANGRARRSERRSLRMALPLRQQSFAGSQADSEQG
jgi:hypothetical protein